MAGQASLLFQFYVLLLMVRPLDPSSRPERDMGTSGLLPEEMELEDMDLESTLWEDMMLVSRTCLLVVLLIAAIVLGCYLGRKLWRWWREKRQSPSAHARPCCCKGHGCPRNLIQLLRHNRDMLLLCLRYGSQGRPGAKRAAKGGIWKRRRLQVSPQC